MGITTIASRLEAALKAANLPIIGVSLFDEADRSTWKVSPAYLQPQAQPVIDAFDPNDPALVAAELEKQVKHALDQERLVSAVVWTILKQMFPSDTDAQTKTKYGVARTRVIDAYRTTPWK